MDADTPLLLREGARPLSPSDRFDRVSIAFHWLTALLVIGQFAFAWLMQTGAGDPVTLLAMHRSMGGATWLVVLARLLWRRIFADVPPLPAAMPELQRVAARLNEYGLYALLLLQPLTGLLDTLFRGRPFAFFLWQVPALLPRDRDIAHLFNDLHELGAWALLALIGLHSAAALLHALVLRDGVLQRMLPTARRNLQ